MKKRSLAAVAVACLLAAVFVPLAAPAAAYSGSGDAVHSITITAELQDNGDAVVTEVWDMTASDSITEWYLRRVNLDEQVISDLQVSENGVQFVSEGEWDVDRTREQKAGRCGIVTLSEGSEYELCWGVGSTGRHKFTVSYHVTNMVKQYDDAGVIYQLFVGDNSTPVDEINIVISKPGLEMTVQNTGVWAGGGAEGDIYVTGGEIVAKTTATYQPGNEFVILVEFADGLFSPGVAREGTFAELKEQVLEGSGYVRPPDEVYEDDGQSSNGSGVAVVMDILSGLLTLLVPVVIFIAIVTIIVRMGKGSSTGGSKAATKRKYAEVPYSRELPWQNSLPATYARLHELGSLDNDGVIIGAWLLRWIRSRQVEIITHQNDGFFNKSEEEAIKLYAPRPGMEEMERSLYDMLLAASGGDYILQSKEFEKWSRKQYDMVDGWLERYRNQGKSVMRQLGALAEEPHKVLFFNTTRTVVTPAGEAYTAAMFGFKKYLEDFTIINEREAREVQLWDEYLVYAQVFGIADRVTEQFRQLYPDYFRQVAADLGYASLDMYDVFLITRITRSYGNAMATGYRAGYNAAHSDSFSGGGGSFGGGGGFSGSSGGGSSSGGR